MLYRFTLSSKIGLQTAIKVWRGIIVKLIKYLNHNTRALDIYFHIPTYLVVVATTICTAINQSIIQLINFKFHTKVKCVFLVAGSLCQKY